MIIGKLQLLRLLSLTKNEWHEISLHIIIIHLQDKIDSHILRRNDKFEESFSKKLCLYVMKNRINPPLRLRNRPQKGH